MQWKDSLPINLDTSLPTIGSTSSSGDGGEDDARPGVMNAGFQYWMKPDTIVKSATPNPKPSQVQESLVWWGGVINYFTSKEGLPWVHTALDIGGMIPEIGAVFDVLNAGLYFYEGNYTMAGLNMAQAASTVITGAPVAKWASIKTKREFTQIVSNPNEYDQSHLDAFQATNACR